MVRHPRTAQNRVKEDWKQRHFARIVNIKIISKIPCILWRVCMSMMIDDNPRGIGHGLDEVIAMIHPGCYLFLSSGLVRMKSGCWCVDCTGALWPADMELFWKISFFLRLFFIRVGVNDCVFLSPWLAWMMSSWCADSTGAVDSWHRAFFAPGPPQSCWSVHLFPFPQRSLTKALNLGLLKSLHWHHLTKPALLGNNFMSSDFMTW